MSYSKYHCSKSPFQKRKSRKEAKDHYITTEAASKLNLDSDMLDVKASQDIAEEKYKKLSGKDKRNLKTTHETDK